MMAILSPLQRQQHLSPSQRPLLLPFRYCAAAIAFHVLSQRSATPARQVGIWSTFGVRDPLSYAETWPTYRIHVADLAETTVEGKQA